MGYERITAETQGQCTECVWSDKWCWFSARVGKSTPARFITFGTRTFTLAAFWQHLLSCMHVKNFFYRLETLDFAFSREKWGQNMFFSWVEHLFLSILICMFPLRAILILNSAFVSSRAKKNGHDCFSLHTVWKIEIFVWF